MESYNFSEQQQEQIYRRLKLLVGPGAAAFYRDACRIMEMELPLESTTHLVGHLLREIESSLRDVLVPPIGQPLEQQSNNKKGSQKKASGGKEKHKAEILDVLEALEIPESATVAQAWLRLTGKDNEYGLSGRAHREDLAPPRPVDKEFKQFWFDIQAVLNEILNRFETRYSDIRRRLDELLVKCEPTEQDLKALRNRIPNSFVTLDYFFRKLQYSAWLKPLQDKGFFKNPPEPEIASESGGIRFLAWPQSRYLLRMASQEPTTVLEIALKVLETGTKNISVHQDLAKAARAMPPALAARWIEKETEWLKEQDYLYFLLEEELGELVTYLAQENQVEAALALLRELLAVVSNSQPPEPHARFDDYYYGKILQNSVPKLLEVSGESTFKILCDLLDDAVRFSQSQDHSHSWRAAIEDHQNNLEHGIRELLITAVRDAAEHFVGNDPVVIRTLVPILESYNWTIFHRIALHLLRRFPYEAGDLIAARLTNRDRFQHQSELYEYKLLMREQFSNLPSEAQETIFTLIVEGPTNKPSTSEANRTLYVKDWQKRWLAILSAYLPPSWQQQYEQLVRELGPAEPLQPLGGVEIEEWYKSPKSSAELASMSMTELFAFLKEWQPSWDDFGPLLQESLGLELVQVIAQKPGDFVHDSEQFKELNAEYRCCFLKGLQKALETSIQWQTSCWLQILEFCSWMLAQLQQPPESKVPDGDFDEEWNRTCNAVVELLRTGLRAEGEKEIPIELRRQIWTILELLAEDPKVTPGFEKHYRYSETGGPVEASVNTVRGKAMYAVIQYALWIKQRLYRDNKGEVQAARGFDEIPEVRGVLARHLDPEQDPSLTIRSIYGRRLPCLMTLDSEWTTENLGRIFPKEEALKELRSAAWEGYMTFSLYIDLFAMLREEYSQAIERIDTATPECQNPSKSDEALAEHLMQLFWRGELEIGEPDKLLERFFEKAPEQRREYFMRRLGRLLSNEQSEVTPELLQRLQQLWEWRISKISGSPATAQHPLELTTFGLWFTSGKFDNKWAMNQLIEALKQAKDVNDDKNVLPCLADIAPYFPRETIECLRLIADGNHVKSLIDLHEESSRAILSTAIQSGDGETCKAAKELINRLLARSIADFGDLLSGGEG